MTVDAKYWRHPDGEYHTITESTALHFAAPQSVLILGAAFGGLIAFYLFPVARARFVTIYKPREDTRFGRVVRELAGIVGAILLSTIVSILVARISDTQFFLKVTITDFWGAIATGFVSVYVGANVLNRLIKIPKGDSSSGQTSSATSQAQQSATPERQMPDKNESPNTLSGG